MKTFLTHAFAHTHTHTHTHRYNISTLEYEAWDSGVNSSLQRVREDVFDGVNNDGEDDINREQISELDVWSRFNFNFMEAAAVS